MFHLKGHEYVNDAAARIVDRLPNARFLFVGDGLLRETLGGELRGLLCEIVLFLQVVSPSEIPRYVSAMDVLVHTSLREGLARALPQALLSGNLPSVRCRGAREVVINGSTGCLVPAQDVSGLAEAMLELGSDADKRDRFGRAGRVLCSETDFELESMTRQIRTVYERILASKGS